MVQNPITTLQVTLVFVTILNYVRFKNITDLKSFRLVDFWTVFSRYINVSNHSNYEFITYSLTTSIFVKAKFF